MRMTRTKKKVKRDNVEKQGVKRKDLTWGEV
jgi:hypothetical protein